MRLLFIHHSTGGLLIRFGKIRKLLKDKKPDLEFWDHGYNLDTHLILSRLFGAYTFKTGLSDQNGKMTGRDYNIVISNNSPKEYADIFTRSPNDLTLKNILEFNVIIFKNCFPTTKIETKDKLEEYKNYYSKIFTGVSRFPNRFVVFTPPPLRREMTTSGWAKNARELSDWLVKQENKNVKVFNFFDLLSDNDGKNVNMLRRENCNLLPFDSHPNISANKKIGKVFVEYISKNV